MLVKRVFLLNAAFAMEILDLISHAQSVKVEKRLSFNCPRHEVGHTGAEEVELHLFLTSVLD